MKKKFSDKKKVDEKNSSGEIHQKNFLGKNS